MSADSSPQSRPDPYEQLAALERRGDQLEAFGNAEKQANKWIHDKGTDSLVAELRTARDERRPMKIGTPTCLVLLKHIDRLEGVLARDPLIKP